MNQKEGKTAVSKEEIAKKHLAKYYHHKGRDINPDDILPMSRILPMMEEYASQLAGSPGGTWVRVEDKLPDINGVDGFNQLVLFDEPFFGDIEKEMTVAYYETSEKKWFIDLSGKELYNVTHWMPLPPKPGESPSGDQAGVSMEEYNHAIDEIGQLQEQLKEAEEHIRDLQREINS